MKFVGVLLALQCASTLAFSIVSGSIKAGNGNLEIGEFNTQEVKQLAIGPKDKIDLSLTIDGLSKKPHQAVVTIGNDLGLEYSVIPKVTPSTNTISVVVPVSQLPGSIKAEDKLFVKVIIADQSSKGANLFKNLAELVPNADLQAANKYKKAERIGIKPEIHHIFKESPSTVGPAVPIIFIFGVITLVLLLLVTWVSTIGFNLFNHSGDISGAQFINDIAFFLCIVGFEGTFVNYYLGASIFTTLFYSAILGGPSIYFGSRVFRDLAKFRKIGK